VVFFSYFSDDDSDHGCFGVVPVPASGCILCVCMGEAQLCVWIDPIVCIFG